MLERHSETKHRDIDDTACSRPSSDQAFDMAVAFPAGWLARDSTAVLHDELSFLSTVLERSLALAVITPEHRRAGRSTLEGQPVEQASSQLLWQRRWIAWCRPQSRRPSSGP